VQNFSQDATVGIIMIPDNWIGYVDDLVRQIRQSKRISTIIIEFPSKFEPEKKNVKEYYKTFTKNQIGFNIEI
jgi:vacuolar-type H+-ATPase subunit F/Vma7